MPVLGIVCEYNPFHEGHSRMIRAVKTKAGEPCGVICVMGGNFMQRGEPAVFSKHARAEAAVLCGADVVFELPLPWAVSSAEGFARGAVGLLGSLGTVTHIGFGSESGEVGPLAEAAEALAEPSTDAKIKYWLDEGLPFAPARQKALREVAGDLALIVEKPNNILAVEYIKALNSQKLPISPLTVGRFGAEHDEPGGGRICSAAYLRSLIFKKSDISGYVPKAAAEIYDREIREGRGPVGFYEIEAAVISRLRTRSAREFNDLPDASGGLGLRMHKAAVSGPTIEAILSEAKTKRYTAARIRRVMICAALGIKPEMSAGTPPYARLLACSGPGRELLRAIKEKSVIPIITKPAKAGKTAGSISKLFYLEAAATDLYVLGFPAREQRRGASEWRASPVIVSSRRKTPGGL
ncbi:MAG: nucleotidyltransferase family protein [Oscillospiraceae bacterium]|nr:nucleotidyltransferase family protein [Oscillospiraceae bacterium]